MALARRAGLGALVATKLTVPGGAGCDAAAKECSIVAGMLTGADSIDDLGVLCDAGDGLLHALVHTGGDGELSPGPADRGDHGMVVERRSPTGSGSPSRRRPGGPRRSRRTTEWS